MLGGGILINYNKYFPVVEYYEKYIVPINPHRYFIDWKGGKPMMVCTQHNDHDPSLGIIPNKNGDIVHCFGCNFAGNIVQFHQGVCRRLFKKVISEDEALKDLCRIFGVDYSSLPAQEKEEDRGVSQELELAKSMERFDISDFRERILKGKREKRGVGYYNTLMMIMIDEIKRVD